MTEFCKNTMEFGDDQGDNETTFTCHLEAGHIGPCVESGELYGESYCLSWTPQKGIKEGKG